MSKEYSYQEQIKRFQTKIQDTDNLVLKIQLFLEEMFHKKCIVPNTAYNAVNLSIENCICMQLCLCWVQFDDSNKLALLKLREIEIDTKYRNNGYCTSIVNFLENIAFTHLYDGVEIETVCSESMLNVMKKLNYFKLVNQTFENCSDYIGNYRKLFLPENS